MTFNLREAKIYKAVSFQRLLIFGPLKFWRILFLVAGFFALAAQGINLAVYKLARYSLLATPNLWVSLAYICIPVGFTILFWEIFFEIYLKGPAIQQNPDNTAELLDFDAASVLDWAFGFSRLMNESAASADSLFLALAGYNRMAGVFIRLGLDAKQIAAQLETQSGVKRLSRGFWSASINPSDGLLALLTDANNLRLKHGGERITAMDLMAALFDSNPIFQKVIINAGLDKNDLASLADWYESNAQYWQNRKKFWRLENLLRRPPIGADWAYGHAYYLSRYATDLTANFQQRYAEIKLIGRQKIVDQIEQVLARAGENNVLLVGEPGVGKRTVILGFTQMIADGLALPALNYKRVFELKLPALTSSAKEPAEIQRLLTTLLNEAVKAGHVILVVEDFQNFIGAMGGLGRLDISQILLPYLESTDIQVIATTDPVSFHKYIESRPEITKVFEKIEIAEPDTAGTLKVIQEMIPAIEAQNKILLTYGAIKSIVDSADRYIQAAPFPEKAIDLLTEVVSRVRAAGKSIVFAQDVLDIVTSKTNIPLGAISGSEKEKLTNLEREMHRDIVGQDEAVRVIVQAMQRLRAGLSRRGKPAGVFLFIGPTGVGKTQTAKVLAKTYFGSPERMIRFDMSEYQDIESLDRFLGNLRINEPGQLTSAARDNPFSVILLDEFEKAHKNILNIFLRVFDEGKMTDVFGRGVNFEQNIIIATSNAAADYIRELVKSGGDPAAQKEQLIDVLVSGHFFSPELLNRFDEIVVYHPLDQGELYKIAELLINALAERLRQQGYIFKPTPDIIDLISRLGFDPQFGARPMLRAIQDKLESVIARKILEGTIQKGAEFTLSLQEIQ